MEDLPNYRFSSGQFLGGRDYRWNEHFSTGLFADYQGAYANYPDGGKVWMNGATFGVYATFAAKRLLHQHNYLRKLLKLFHASPD